MIKNRYIIILLFPIFILISCNEYKEKETPIINTVQIGNTFLSLTEEATDLHVPWDLQYDRINNAIIFSEIKGSIKRFDIYTKKITEIDSITDVFHQRTLGLLGMALYQPNNQQAYLYLSYTSKKDSSIYSNLYRYNYSEDGQLSAPKLLLQIPGNTGHNGSRIIISTDNKVYWATGDAAIDTYAQDSTSLNGKILRLNLDGSIPSDNPIPNSYVYAWGFRNMQGLTNDETGKIYTSEHGDAIEDEVNLILPLKNYGWPLVEGKSESKEQKSIADQIHFQAPLISWTPTIAPSGMAYFGSNTVPEWKNSLLVTTLKNQSLHILKLSEDGLKIDDEYILFGNQLGRLRSVIVLPNGDIYFCSSNRDWNPQKGFPKSHDDKIYRLRKTTEQKSKIIKPENTNKNKSITKSGQQLYEAYCSSCHKPDGKGILNTFPPLSKSNIVNGDDKVLLNIILHGLQQKNKKDLKYEGIMPSFNFLKDEEVISIANYVRQNFDNNARTISIKNIKSLR